LALAEPQAQQAEILYFQQLLRLAVVAHQVAMVVLAVVRQQLIHPQLWQEEQEIPQAHHLLKEQMAAHH
jgi:hypothetical protein